MAKKVARTRSESNSSQYRPSATSGTARSAKSSSCSESPWMAA